MPGSGEDSIKEVHAILVDSSGRPYVILSDGTTSAGIDSKLGALCVIQAEHHEIHVGESFIASYFWDDVADNGTARMHIVVGADKELHATITVVTEAKGELDLLEGTTWTANGTAVTIYDKNRTTGNTSNATAYRDGTINAAGTKILESFMPGGTKNFAVGSARSGAQEWIFKKSTDYLVRWQNRGGAVKDCAIIIEFYEVS